MSNTSRNHMLENLIKDIFLTILIPSSLVMILIVYFYYHILKQLKLEANNNDPISISKRIFAIRLIFYPIAYLFQLILSWIAYIAIISTFQNNRNGYIGSIIFLIIVIIMYPVMNAIIYWITERERSSVYRIFLDETRLNDEESVFELAKD